MRVIVTNEDALRLERLIEQHPGAPLAVQIGDEGSAATVIVASESIRGTAWRTPGSAAGSFAIEDYDGRCVVEGIPEE